MMTHIEVQITKIYDSWMFTAVASWVFTAVASWVFTAIPVLVLPGNRCPSPALNMFIKLLYKDREDFTHEQIIVHVLSYFVVSNCAVFTHQCVVWSHKSVNFVCLHITHPCCYIVSTKCNWLI